MENGIVNQKHIWRQFVLRGTLTLLFVLAINFNTYAQQTNTSTDITYLQHPGTKAYYLDSGDVLGIFIEGVLGKLDSNPPIQMPAPGSDLPPSMGYPVVVQRDGTVSLPLVKPISVRGMTLEQAEQRIANTYRGANSRGERILRDTNRIIVTLQRERTVRVTVIRQDNSRSASGLNRGTFNSQAVSNRSDQSGRGTVLQMPAYKNDLLHAMLQTGGLPGVNAKSDVRVLRSQSQYGGSSSYRQTPSTQSPFPRTGPASLSNRSSSARPSNYYRPPAESRISIRGGAVTNRANSVLQNGDVVLIESKPTEVFYTGGLLRAGQYLLPSDKSLNILEAVAIAGGSTAPRSGPLGFPRFPASELTIVRNRPGANSQNIRVDLQRAYSDPSQRVLVRPGDTLILNYKPQEQAGNVGIGVLRYRN